VKSEIGENVQFLVQETLNGMNKDLCLNDLLKHMTGEIIDMSGKITTKDVIMYIYTSGTTGLPKVMNFKVAIQNM